MSDMKLDPYEYVRFEVVFILKQLDSPTSDVIYVLLDSGKALDEEVRPLAARILTQGGRELVISPQRSSERVPVTEDLLTVLLIQ
jgi:hypothetical protein